MIVRKPARAATIAMPAPMVPAPATPTVLILVMSNLPPSTLQKASSDQLSMYLVGAFPDLGDLRVTHQALDAMILAVAVATQQLHGLRGHAHRQIRGSHFQDRGFRAEVGLSAIHCAPDGPQ